MKYIPNEWKGLVNPDLSNTLWCRPPSSETSHLHNTKPLSQCPCSLSIQLLHKEGIPRSIFVILTYQSFSELWRSLETLHESSVHFQSVANAILTDSVSISVHLSARSSPLEPKQSYSYINLLFLQDNRRTAQPFITSQTNCRIIHKFISSPCGKWITSKRYAVNTYGVMEAQLHYSFIHSFICSGSS
jgi:hypothetical protein